MPARWPVLKRYDQNHLLRIALPLGGIGTGTVSLGGRGDLRDWELANRPAKGFIPRALGSGVQSVSPFFAVWARDGHGRTFTRALEGALDPAEYEGPSGSTAANHGLPRFARCSFAAAYPLGQVFLDDPALPFSARLQAFNPLVPADSETSGLPVAILRYSLRSRARQPLQAALCTVLPNFIGCDAIHPVGAAGNQTAFCESRHLRGLYMESTGVDPQAEAWGSLALGLVNPPPDLSFRTNWRHQAGGRRAWGNSLLDFWDDFSTDGALDECPPDGADLPVGSLCARFELLPGVDASLTFILAWHFPNRYTWTPDLCDSGEMTCKQNWIGNYYASRFSDAWAAAEHAASRLDTLERQTVRFVRAFCGSDLPVPVKEAALFNLSTLRSQTCFRTADGRFFGWEGCNNLQGCCHGSCTHVWNYEQATAFLFGDLSRQMREVEFAQTVRADGLMSFRVNLPLEKAKNFARAAADGQMGCIMKIYRDWQLSGDDGMLCCLWPNVRKALEFCWVPGGWDADRDGVMEGCQHNTMDVEYFGPNPQMESWYLGALRAAEEMASHLGEDPFAAECRRLFENGRAWTDANLFNGEYYIHQVRPPRSPDVIAPGLMVGMGAADLSDPDFQLGPGCLVDQLVGQYMAHICGLGYLLDPAHVRTALHSIYRYNLRRGFHDHFNCMRSYVLGDETALLMASYPDQRPARPFPYFTEVMTGFEYTAAVGMLYEGLEEFGLDCIANIRERYDGRKRSPFDEAECGHHYARAMAAWAAVLALSGFHYSAVEKKMAFTAREGRFLWSTGDAWGTVRLSHPNGDWQADLAVLGGKLALDRLELENIGPVPFTLR